MTFKKYELISQRIIVIVCFLLAIISFFYSLAFFTDLKVVDLVDEDFYKLAQKINKKMFNYSLLLVICGSLLLLFKNEKKYKYHIINYLLLIIYSVLSLFYVNYTFPNIEKIKNTYNSLDFTLIKIIHLDYKVSNKLFNFGLTFNYFIIIGGILSLVLCITKLIRSIVMRRVNNV